MEPNVEALAAAVERARLSPAGLAALPEDIRQVADAYEALKRQWGRGDFADLLHLALEVLDDPCAASTINWPTELLVDDAQDTNLLQLAMVERLASRDRSVVVVGDANQAIYGFQGAAAGALRLLSRRRRRL